VLVGQEQVLGSGAGLAVHRTKGVGDLAAVTGLRQCPGRRLARNERRQRRSVHRECLDLRQPGPGELEMLLALGLVTLDDGQLDAFAGTLQAVEGVAGQRPAGADTYARHGGDRSGASGDECDAALHAPGTGGRADPGGDRRGLAHSLDRCDGHEPLAQCRPELRCGGVSNIGRAKGGAEGEQRCEIRVVRASVVLQQLSELLSAPLGRREHHRPHLRDIWTFPSMTPNERGAAQVTGHSARWPRRATPDVVMRAAVIRGPAGAGATGTSPRGTAAL